MKLVKRNQNRNESWIKNWIIAELLVILGIFLFGTSDFPFFLQVILVALLLVFQIILIVGLIIMIEIHIDKRKKWNGVKKNLKIVVPE